MFGEGPFKFDRAGAVILKEMYLKTFNQPVDSLLQTTR